MLRNQADISIQVIGAFGKVSEYKINIQKETAFPYTYNECPKVK